MSIKKYQPGFVDLETRANQLTEMGDPLVDLKLRIDWEAFRVDLVVATARQQDVNARWAKKNEETHYGYQNHINADAANQLIQDYAVTEAAVHDSQMQDQLLDYTKQADGTTRPVYADSAYRSQARETQLAKAELQSQICVKGSRGHPLTEAQKNNNRNNSKVRARVEHIFGAQNQMGGHLVRTIEIASATTKIGMMNLVYNMKRLVQLLKREALKDASGSSRDGLAGVTV